MYCTKCGNEVPEGYKFCPKCGAKLVVPLAENQARQAASSAPAVSQKKAEPKPDAKAEAAQPQIETAAPTQSHAGKKSKKKAVWIGIVIAVIVILVIVLVLVLVRNKQSSTPPAAVTSTQVSQSATASTTAKITGYLADVSLIPDNYVETYRNDLLGKINGANQQIVEAGFSRANNVNKPEGKTHNSLCFLVENDDGTYDLYEYADIKIDENNNLLPPVYKGATKHLNSWDDAQDYLRDKSSDTYHYEVISNY